MADHHLGQSNAASSAEEKRTTRQKGARHTERQDANEGPARFAISARRLPIMLGGLILAVLLALWLWPREKDEKEASKETAAEVEGEPNEVALTPEAMKTAGIEIGQVTERPAVALLSVAASWPPSRASRSPSWRGSCWRQSPSSHCPPPTSSAYAWGPIGQASSARKPNSIWRRRTSRGSGACSRSAPARRKMSRRPKPNMRPRRPSTTFNRTSRSPARYRQPKPGVRPRA